MDDEGLRANALLNWIDSYESVEVMTSEDRAAITRLELEIDRLDQEYDNAEDPEPDLLDQKSELEDELEELRNKIDVYNIIRTGDFYSLGEFEVIARLFIERAEEQISMLENQMDGDNDDDIQEKIDELNELIESHQDEITEIEENPDGEYPEDLIEDKVRSLVSDVRYDPEDFMESYGLEWDKFIDRDDFIQGVIDADGYGQTLNSYDGSADEVKVGDKWFYVMRID